MEYLVTFDGECAFGRHLLGLHGKEGGAVDLMHCGLTRHPVIVCRDIDWVTLSPFVRMQHIRNAVAKDPTGTDLVVPASTILFAIPKSALLPEQPTPDPAAAIPREVH